MCRKLKRNLSIEQKGQGDGGEVASRNAIQSLKWKIQSVRCNKADQHNRIKNYKLENLEQEHL